MPSKGIATRYVTMLIILVITIVVIIFLLLKYAPNLFDKLVDLIVNPPILPGKVQK